PPRARARVAPARRGQLHARQDAVLALLVALPVVQGDGHLGRPLALVRHAERGGTAAQRVRVEEKLDLVDRELAARYPRHSSPQRDKRGERTCRPPRQTPDVPPRRHGAVAVKTTSIVYVPGVSSV